MGESRWAYASGTSDKPLLGLTIGDMLDQTTDRFPDNEALVVVHQNVRLSYRELQQEANRCARALMASGIEKGERVGIWATNRFEWTLIQFATAKMGAILVNINPAYRINELDYALRQSGCSALVMSRRFKTSDYVGMLRSMERPESLRLIVLLDDAPEEGMVPWKELLARADEVPAEALAERQSELQFDDPINIQYTSGTTGRPKGATLSHHNILNNGYFVAERMGFTDQDRLVVPVPLYHCFGMVMGNLGCVTHGATMLYASEAFEPGKVLETVARERATALYGVPTMFIAELEHPDFTSFDLTSLRTGIMAGSPCPVEVMKKVQELMHMSEVEIAYGMTETSPVSFQTRADAPLDKRVSTVGQIHPHVEVKIVEPDTGRVVPVETTGELCTRGYSVMLGYWNHGEATREAVDAAGWMHTGDLATMDAEGYVRIVGRSKDLVIRGGENIYPREIEEFLYTHPKVSDVQVIGVPDAKFGEEVMAWVKLKEGESATEEELRAFCVGKIAHFKIPRYFKFVDAFPMTVTGKIQKFVMREQSTKELGLA